MQLKKLKYYTVIFSMCAMFFFPMNVKANTYGLNPDRYDYGEDMPEDTIIVVPEEELTEISIHHTADYSRLLCNEIKVELYNKELDLSCMIKLNKAGSTETKLQDGTYILRQSYYDEFPEFEHITKMEPEKFIIKDHQLLNENGEELKYISMYTEANFELGYNGDINVIVKENSKNKFDGELSIEFSGKSDNANSEDVTGIIKITDFNEKNVLKKMLSGKYNITSISFDNVTTGPWYALFNKMGVYIPHSTGSEKDVYITIYQDLNDLSLDDLYDLKEGNKLTTEEYDSEELAKIYNSKVEKIEEKEEKQTEEIKEEDSSTEEKVEVPMQKKERDDKAVETDRRDKNYRDMFVFGVICIIAGVFLLVIKIKKKK